MHSPALGEEISASGDLAALAPPTCDGTNLAIAVEARSLPAFDRPLQPGVRAIGLLGRPPWVRSLGKLQIEVRTQGWRFPVPSEPVAPLRLFDPDAPRPPSASARPWKSRTPVRP